MTRARAFLSWLATPFRVIARGMMVLVNLTPRQMQALVTLFVIGGLMVYCWHQWFYVALARAMATDPRVSDDSPAWDVLTDAASSNFWLSAGCLLTLCAIAFGAEWLRVKYKDFEAGTSRSAQEAAQDVADAAQDEADSMGGTM